MKAPDSDDTRARLLKAAVEVFAERGYENSTIRDICSRAGANVALIHYHFGDKLELYREVLRFSLTCGSPQTPLPPSTGPAESLRQVIGAMVEKVFETGDRANLRYRLMLNEFSQPSAHTAQIVEELIRPLLHRLREIVGELLGLPPDHEKTRLCVHSVIGQIAYYGRSAPMLRTLWPEMKMDAAQRELVADHIAEFSLTYLMARRQTGRSQQTPGDPKVTRSLSSHYTGREQKRRSNKHGSESEASGTSSGVEGTGSTL